MGEWANDCCNHCRPSTKLADDLGSIVKFAPDGWKFQVICENGSLPLIGMPKNENTFVVAAFLPSDDQVIPKLTIAFLDSERWVVRVRSEHNVCAANAPAKGSRLFGQIVDLQSRIHSYHNEFLNWTRLNREGELSVSVFRKYCDDQEDAEDQFLQAIDLVEEKGWND